MSATSGRAAALPLASLFTHLPYAVLKSSFVSVFADLEAIADKLNPLTISQTARTISCTAMGRIRSAYPVTYLSLNKANKQAASIRALAAIPQPDSHRGTSRD